MIKSILSIVAGTCLWGVLWVAFNALLAVSFPGQFDPNGVSRNTVILAAILTISIALSVLAGFATATIAGRSQVAHAAILAVVQLAIGIGVQSQLWTVMPIWYHLTFLAMIAPATVLGGKIRSRRTATGAVAVT
jgi:hypothetical protein